ncbi:MAG: hypothetical protein ACRBBQ_00830 [Cognatishimia sp.]
MFSGAATGQSLSITSGDHPGFTRLAVELPHTGAPWELTKTGGIYHLKFPGETPVFETGRVFQKISRRRLADVSTLPNGALELALNCTCNIKAFIWKSRFLVLDIRPGTAAEAPQNSPPRSANPDPLALAFAPQLPHAKGTIDALPFAIGEASATQSPPAKKPGFTLPLAHTSNNADLPLPRAVQPLHNEENQLVNSVLLATSHGLLVPQPRPANPIKNRTPSNTSQRQDLDTVETAADPFTNNFDVISAIERGDTNTLAVPRVDATKNCIESNALDISAWASGADFTLELANHRMALMSDIDLPDPDSALKLVKFYLYSGFGAEAEAALSLAAVSTGDRQVLTVLARVFDSRAFDDLSPFSGMETCSNAAALWAMLTLPENAKPKPLNKAAIQASFTDLPTHLRHHLAPRLSKALFQTGNPTLATKILQIAGRSAPDNAGAQALAQAQIALQSGDTNLAHAVMSDLVQIESEQTPEALATLVQSQFTAKTPIAPDHAALLSALALEHRAHSIGPELRQAHAMARTANQQYRAALDALATLRKHDGTAAWKALLQPVVQRIAQDAADDIFLQLTLNDFAEIARSLKPEVTNALAERLLSLGFAQEAQKFASLGAEGAIGRTRRMLRAKIAISQRRPRQALAHLLGMHGPEVDALRAQAQRDAGDFATASQLFQDLGLSAQAEQIAWQTGNWTALEASEIKPHQTIAKLLADTAPEITSARAGTPPLSLAQSQALLDKSLTTRQALQDLLETHQFEGAFDNP